MNELIKYFEALEARLSAQEARIAALEQYLNEKNQIVDQLAKELLGMSEVLDAMGEHLKKVDAALAEDLQQSVEPEVEVELVYPEDEQEAPAEPAPVVELQPADEPIVEVVPAPEIEEQPEEKPVEEPVAEPEPEPVKEESVQVPQEEAPKPKAPQQTSLFGAPVTDIRQAVSIGDRFLFQRELFAGSAENLQKALTELNSLHSFDEAMAAIEKYGWDKQSPTFELFVNVLRRRFQ